MERRGQRGGGRATPGGNARGPGARGALGSSGSSPRRSPAPDTPPAPGAGGDPNLVPLGEFGRAQGLRGEIRVKSYTEDPAAIAHHGPLRLPDGRPIKILSARPAGGSPDMLVVRVAGIETREAAEALNRTAILIARSDLPPPDEEDEFLAADLIGLAVVTPAGDTLGRVIAVPNYGGGDLIEIAPATGGASALLPFTRAFVPEIDVPGGRIVVDAPDDLFEPARPEDPEGPVDGM